MPRFSPRDEAQWDTAMAQVTAVARRVLGPAFEQAMRAVAQQVSEAELVRLLATGGATALEERLLAIWAQASATWRTATQQALAQLGTASAEVFGASLLQAARTSAPRPPVSRIPPALTVQFDAYNPLTAQAIQQWGAAKVVQATDGLRSHIRAVVTQGVTLGENPRTTARWLRESIGLTATQWQHVQNYRKYLVEGDPTALDRVLRDKRYDPLLRRHLAGKVTLTKEQVDTQVAAYIRRYRKHRAETIARTEALEALHLGHRLVWVQAAEEGRIKALPRRFWHVARDERLCEWCRPVPGLNPEGVGFDQVFTTPLGPRSGPLLHPDCRCIVFHRLP